MKTKPYFVMCCICGAIIIATLLIIASTPRSALACEPTAIPPGSVSPTPIPIATQVAGASRNAEVVLDGIVQTWVTNPDSTTESILTVQVERYLKGHGPKTVKISGYFWDCPPNFAFHEGSHSIFFVNGDPASKAPLQVRGWFDAQEAVVTSVRNSTGQEPIVPDATNDVLWLSVVAILVLGGITFIRYRHTRF